MPTPAQDVPVLVTGAAGFIGSHLCGRLLADGVPVVGVDWLRGGDDHALQRDRLDRLSGRPGFSFAQQDIADPVATARLFDALRPTRVVHLAAEVGVRRSIAEPDAYVHSNVLGFTQVLEGCRRAQTRHLLYASSSSVYGLNHAAPSREADPVDHPISLYAATKRANELMAHTWATLHGLPCTGLRFFTVYGPWGRPDMALYRFTRALLRGEPLPLYNHGAMQRDLTYVDDVVEAIVRLLDHPPAPDPGRAPDAPDRSPAPFRICNVGNHSPVPLTALIAALERATGRSARLDPLPMQPGDVRSTFADTEALAAVVGFAPGTPLEEGVARYVDWFMGYYPVE